MTGSVRERVSKWDLVEEIHVSSGFQLESDQAGDENSSFYNMPSYERHPNHGEGQISTFPIPQGGGACDQLHRSDSEAETDLSKTDSVLLYAKPSDVEMGKKDIAPWGPIPGSKTEFEKDDDNAQNSKWSDGDFDDRDKSWFTAEENKIDDKNDNNEEKDSGLGSHLGPIDNISGSEHTNSKPSGEPEGKQDVVPISGGKAELEADNDKSRKSKWSYGYSDDGDKTWFTSKENKSNNEKGDDEKNGSGRGTSLGLVGNESSVLGLDVWQQGWRSTSPKIDSRSPRKQDSSSRSRSWSRSRSRSKSRSLSPDPGYRKEYNSNARNTLGPKLYRETCRAFLAGRCTRGSQCRYLHDDGGKKPDRLDKPDKTDNRGRYERVRPMEGDNKDYLKGSMDARGSSQDRVAHGRSHRYDEEREEHDDYRNKRPTMQCINYTRGKCFRGAACKYAHNDVSHDGGLLAKDGERERVHDWGQANPQSTHDLRHEYRRTNSILCKFFAEGRCRNGDKCRFSHQGSVQGAETGKPDDDKRVNHGGNESRPMWSDPRYGKPTILNSQSNVSGWGGTSSHPITGTFHSSDTSITPGLQPQAPQASFPELVSQTGQTQQIVPLNPFGSNPTIPPNAHNQYFNSQGYPSVENLGSSSHYSSFGSQGQNVYSQPSNVLAQYPPLQPAADKNQQSTTQIGYGIHAGQDNHLPELNKVAADHTSVVNGQQMAPITNLSASLAQIFGNDQQLPQLYAALNPSDPGVSSMAPMSQPSNVIPASSAAPPIPPQSGLWLQQHQNSISSSFMPPNPTGGNVSSQIPSNLVEPTALESNAPTRHKVVPNNIGDHHGSTGSGWKMNENKMIETGGQNGSGKFEIPMDQRMKDVSIAPIRVGGGDPEIDKGDKKDMDKDAKGIRVFKYALVEFVKETLKPIWKEGNMSKEVHKTIVKKVVDKVTGSLQSNIPQTQEKIDIYMDNSKGKLSKLVQAYVEKFSKV